MRNELNQAFHASRRATVYLVDGDPKLRMLVEQLCERGKYLLTTFHSAEELLESSCFQSSASCRCSSHARMPPPVESGVVCLVSELLLPGMNGLALLRWLSDRHLLMPIVFASSCQDLNLAGQAIRQGALEVMAKPVVESRLEKAISLGLKQSLLLHRFEVTCELQKEKLLTLSPREQQILDRIIRRIPVKQIAVELRTSPHTVRNQRQNVLEKLDANDDFELLLIVIAVRMHEEGWHWPLLPVLSGESALPRIMLGSSSFNAEPAAKPSS